MFLPIGESAPYIITLHSYFDLSGLGIELNLTLKKWMILLTAYLANAMIPAIAVVVPRVANRYKDLEGRLYELVPQVSTTGVTLG